MFPPQTERAADIRILTLFRAAEQQVDFSSLLPEIHAVAGAEVEPELRDSLACRLNVAEKSVFEPVDAYANPCSGLYVKTVEPFSERLPSVCVLANENLSRRGFQVCLRARPQCDI